MTNHQLKYTVHPEDAKSYGTEKLRDHFLLDNLFLENSVNLTYSMYDRYIVGGANPKNQDLALKTVPYLKSEHFLDRREIGIVNVGNRGVVSVDGIAFELDRKEALYVGKGVKEVVFKTGGDPLFYFNSAPAHKSYPTQKVGVDNAEVIELGNPKYANQRILKKLIVNGIVETCQLQMGITELVEGNVWNTIPAHTHERRMEAYFYFELEKGQTICHFMGQPQHTRHIFMQANQAILSPEWSIHSGAGTSNYSFVWGMAGENLDYGDMDICPTDNLK
ncbi:5-dehydro-4-deoxy-D-glucuronate isomerase [Flagellimonas sp.]|uniref:5-dehydro-4-deoxy-D-glucuronate isomerase n=1 Tax=Flagellimonas sp. TaxID=2058762 RepID=UPI003BB04FC6